MNIKQYIREKAEDIGIDIIGFSSVKPFERARDVLIHRRESHMSCSMEEEDIELRSNPKLFFSNAKSFVTIGISYNVDYESDDDERLNYGKLSRVTWGEDYHKVLKEYLQMLADEIKKLVDFEYEICVDTSPLIDREVAMRSSIGWFGKNCSIINDQYGSFIYIGYLVTDIDLGAEDESVYSKCNDCELCVKACPTGALKGDYDFDANKCISYLTQTKDKIPYDLRVKMGNSIYGCDICQMACPYNNEIQISNKSEFLPIKTKDKVNLENIIFLTKKEFNEIYKEMSGSWRGKNVLRRNAIIALGNSKNKNKIDILKKLLFDPSEMIREYSAWAICNIDQIQGKSILKEHLKHEKSERVRKEITNIMLK